MEDNRLTAKEFIRNNGISEFDFMDSGVTDMFAELMEEYSNKQNDFVNECLTDELNKNADFIKQVDELKGENEIFKDAYAKQLNYMERYNKLQEQNESLSQVIQSQKQTMDALIKKYDELSDMANTMNCRLQDFEYYHEDGEQEDLPFILELTKEILNKYNQAKQ